MDDVADEEDVDEDISPFDDVEEAGSDDGGDTWLEPSALMEQMFAAVPSEHAPTSGHGGLGLADELEPGEIEVPEPEELGRGKRRRVQTKKFDGFVGH